MKHVSELLCSLDDSWRQFSALWRKAQATASEPAIHELRVTARRLSARLELAGSVLNDKDGSAAKKQVRKALKRLGPLRDIHVEMEMIAEVSQDVAANGFRRNLKRAADREVAKVGRYLKGGRRQQIKDGISRLRSNLDRHTSELDDDSIRKAIYRLALRRRDKYVKARMRFEAGGENSLHPMRIALKKFRYVVEAGQDIAGGWTEQTLKRMQAAQRLMGATRDIEVLMSEFRSWGDRHGRQSEVSAILQKLERKRKMLIAKIAKSARALDRAVPKEAIRPARETTHAVSGRSRRRKAQIAGGVGAGEPSGVSA